MFVTLLAVTFVISLLVSGIVVAMFAKPIDGILQRIIADPISQAWVKYVKFAIYVVGISSGVRIWGPGAYSRPLGARSLSDDHREPSGVAWLLLVFFTVALMAFVIVRVFEMKKGKVAAT